MAQVLVVEDDDMLRRVITLALARRDYSVAEADSFAAAAEMLEAAVHPIDVIVLDVNLPDRTGWDLLRALPALQAGMVQATVDGGPAPLPQVIIVTAVRPAQCRLEEFAPAAWLVKPFPIDALIRLLGRLISRRAAASQAGESASPQAAESA